MTAVPDDDHGGDVEIVRLGRHRDDGDDDDGDLDRDDELLAAFHAGPYLDAFAHQREPLAVWQRRLRDPDAPYQLTVQIAGRALRDPARRVLHGGVAYEWYPRSGCGLATYLVVTSPWRGRGLGRRLLTGAVDDLRARGAGRADGGDGAPVFGEIADPSAPGPGEDAAAAAARLARFRRWGARVVDAPYAQPSLGPGLARDQHLRLLALAGTAPAPATIAGPRLAAFVRELFVANEGAPPDDELEALLAAIPATVVTR